VNRRLLTACTILLTANLLAASCSRKNLPPLVAPSDPGRGAFPPWAAVGDESTYAVTIRGSVALEMPLLRMGAEMLMGMATRSGLDYAALCDALGFDPVLDIGEVMITDAGGGEPGQGRRRQAIVLGYDRDVSNLDVVLKLVGSTASGAGGPSVEKRMVGKREVFFIDEPEVAIVGLDASTVGVLRRFGPDDVEAWLEAASRPSDVRSRAAAAVHERLEDPRAGLPETRLASAWIDVTALRQRGGLDASPPDEMHMPLPAAGLRHLVESMDTMVLHASYDGDLAFFQQSLFATPEQAARATDTMTGMMDSLSGSSMPLVGHLLGQVAETLAFEVDGPVLLATWTVPEDVLEAATAFFGLFIGMAQAMSEKGGGQVPAPLLPLPLPGPVAPPPGI
jgi:hypothetical protein